MGMDTFNKYAQLHECHRRFRRACDQIVLLNARLEDMNECYVNARNNGNRPFRYRLCMRILTIEGIIQMYVGYASAKKEKVENLRRTLNGEDPDDNDQFDGFSTDGSETDGSNSDGSEMSLD